MSHWPVSGTSSWYQ